MSKEPDLTEPEQLRLQVELSKMHVGITEDDLLRNDTRVQKPEFIRMLSQQKSPTSQTKYACCSFSSNFQTLLDCDCKPYWQGNEPWSLRVLCVKSTHGYLAII